MKKIKELEQNLEDLNKSKLEDEVAKTKQIYIQANCPIPNNNYPRNSVHFFCRKKRINSSWIKTLKLTF